MKKTNLQATIKYAKQMGNEIPIGIPIVKTEVYGEMQWLGLKLTTMTTRQKLQELIKSRPEFYDFLDKFETTNILMAVDHLNQHGPLSTAGHAYVIRLNSSDTKWELINPGECLDLEYKKDWIEIKEIFSDAAEARFYEIIGTGRKHLQEAADLLRQINPTLQKQHQKVRQQKQDQEHS